MNLLIALVIGAGLGTATGLWFQRYGDYMFFDLLVGIVGSVLGLALVFLSSSDEMFGLFSIGGILGSIIGASVAIALYQVVLRIPKKKKGNIES